MELIYLKSKDYAKQEYAEQINQELFHRRELFRSVKELLPQRRSCRCVHQTCRREHLQIPKFRYKFERLAGCCYLQTNTKCYSVSVHYLHKLCSGKCLQSGRKCCKRLLNLSRYFKPALVSSNQISQNIFGNLSAFTAPFASE